MVIMKGLSLEELVKNAKQGDKKSLEEIFQRFQGFIYKKSCEIYIKDYELEDLIQVGNLSILKAIRKFNEDSGKEFLPYVTLTIQNNYYYLIRGKARYGSETSLNKKNDVGEELLNILKSDENIEEELIKKEETGYLKNVINDLDDVEKEFVHSVFYNNMSIATYSSTHNKKYSSCIKLKNKIIKKIRKYYENMGL